VVVSCEPEPDEYMLELVKTLFGDCEICVVSGMGEMLAQCQADSFSGLGTTEPIGRA
jgi:3-methyladenine DNA glycosylase AlkD